MESRYCREGRWDGKHRYRCRLNDSLGHTAEKDTPRCEAAAATQSDQIDFFAERNPDDLYGRNTLPENCAAGKTLRLE